MRTTPEDRVRAAIDELKSEQVPVLGKAATRVAMLTASEGRRGVPALATFGAIAVVVAMALWPQRQAMAWGQVVQSTLSVPRVHHADFRRSSVGSGWTEAGEEWVDGKKNAVKYRISTQKNQPDFLVDVRYDGKRYYRLRLAGFGEVFDKSPGHRFGSLVQQYTLAELLASSYLKVDRTPTEVTLDGKQVLRYAGKASEGPQKFAFSAPMAFYVDKESGRILRSEDLDPKGSVTAYSIVDYPASIPANVFTPPASGTRVYDLDRDAKLVRESMEHGVPFGYGNVLRAAIQSPQGELVLIWTGTPIGAGALPRPIVDGHPSRHIFAPAELNLLWKKFDPKRSLQFEGRPLFGLAMQLRLPAAGRVTIHMPVLVQDRHRPDRDGHGAIRNYYNKQAGTATIRDYPVIQTIPFGVLTYMNGSRQW